VQSVRDQLVSKFELATRKCDPDETLGDSVYALLRVASEVDICVDGWEVFRVKSETNEYLEAVGMMALLPSGSIPIAISILGKPETLAWSVRLGEENDEWRSLSESKRWKKFYLYATGSASEPPWSWGKQYRGFVTR
jgi:hypothetical protein